jgi:osmotically-inducible protein OsmY
MLAIRRPYSGTEKAPASAAAQPPIQELAESKLRGNSYLALKNLSCEYEDGTLVLRGCLPTYYLKQLAQETVAHLEGVTRVENQIQVLASDSQPAHGTCPPVDPDVVVPDRGGR